MFTWLDGFPLRSLETGLDASSLRQRVLADNIANVDTPGFKRSDVDFPTVMATTLRDSALPELPLKLTSWKHLPGAETPSGAVIKDTGTLLRNDGNNVDIEREMTNVAENGLYYDGLTASLSMKLAQFRTVIKGDP
ncbi:MAG: flagellar basal body rod protein FlgB [Peptococcaceae bacterium]|jgi:flagellar basal-body rod protein FlgB|nr:flagellar basal body rod protein FlgB [Peptococcaceae bacterium]